MIEKLASPIGCWTIYAIMIEDLPAASTHSVACSLKH